MSAVPVHLSAGGVSVVLDGDPTRLPEVLHWGAALGDLGEGELLALAAVQHTHSVTDQVDERVRVSAVPEHSAGWFGRPGLSGHVDGEHVWPRFVGARTVEGTAVRTEVSAPEGVGLVHELEVTPEGLVRQRLTVSYEGPGTYTLDDAGVVLPVPLEAGELLDFTGRHLRERHPQRHEFAVGQWVRENRRGRTGLDSGTILIAGEPGFGFRSGQVWGVHPAWSGNHRMVAEHSITSRKSLGAGELLLPGEIRLRAGERYTSPWVYFSWGRGLDELSARFHRHLRAVPGRATRTRPVTLNVWEAVYFDHDGERLADLARRAGALGVERYVLDDGWFGARRHDGAGLGDWTVSADVWPDGLGPLIEAVHANGMEFGLWVEPEMVNPDSDLARAHPEWILGPGAGRTPIESRHQQVLDLTQPGAYAHVRDAIVALLDAYDIAYLKWDHNRDLLEPGDSGTGHPRVHEQTLAFYRLVDELKAHQPGLEIESCSSGGGRVDVEVLAHTDRIWTSDCIDALERQTIQRWTGLIVPPELMGQHIGADEAHTTHRRQGVDFRAATALLGHFGLEWDLAKASPAELEGAAAWIAEHKKLRGLIATGTTVRVDDGDGARNVYGVVAPDGGEAVFVVAATATSVHYPAPPVRLAGLDPERAYTLTPIAPTRETRAVVERMPWADGVTLPGRVLMEVGVAAPTLYPETALAWHLQG